MPDYGLSSQDKKLIINAQRDIALGQALLNNYLLYVSYFFYVQYGTHMQVNKIHREIAEFLDAVVRLEITRGIINVAPRVGKTELISIGFPAYGLAYNPKSKFICTSYADRLVNANSDKTKALIQTTFNPDRGVAGHVNLYPNTKIAVKKTNTKDEWYTTEGGGLYAVPLGGQITGFGAGDMYNKKFSGAILIDDPLKPADANSEVLREKVNNDFINTLYSRKNHINTPIVLIMQRLHENDLSGFLLDGGSQEQWDLLKIPVLDENEKPVWGWRYPLEEINRLRRQNNMTFSGQYMQEPSPEEGTIIKVKEFKYYQETPQVASKIMVVDGAWEEGTMNDYTVFDIWGDRGSDSYLLDKKRFKAEFSDMYNAFLEFYKKHLPKFVIIEKKASGIALISMLKKEHNVPFVEYETGSTSKSDRARSVAMFIPQGKVHLPSQQYLDKRKEIEKGYDNDWLSDFLNECKNFPVGKNDDSVDTMTMYLQHKYLSEKGQPLYLSFSREHNVARLPIIGFLPIDATLFISPEGVNVCIISQFNHNYQLKIFDCIVDESGNVSMFVQNVYQRLKAEYSGLRYVIYANSYHDSMDEHFNGNVDTIRDALNDKECFDLIEKNLMEFVMNEQGLRESKFSVDMRADKLINALDGGIRYEYKEQGLKPAKIVQRIKPYFQINECLNLVIYKKFIDGFNNIVSQQNTFNSQQIQNKFTIR